MARRVYLQSMLHLQPHAQFWSHMYPCQEQAEAALFLFLFGPKEVQTSVWTAPGPRTHSLEVPNTPMPQANCPPPPRVLIK